MLDLTLLLEDDDLRRRFGSATLHRARDYVADQRVLGWREDGLGAGGVGLRAQVAGSGGAPYTVYVALEMRDAGPWFYTKCSCPVGGDCKHAVALMLTARATHEEQVGSPRRWERRLSAVLDELDDRAYRDGAAVRPLALQVELNRRPDTSFRGWSEQAGTARTTNGVSNGRPVGTLRIRPLKRGARDNWVRTGVSWQEVPYLDRLPGYATAQVAVLGELVAAYRAAMRHTYFGSESHLALGSFGAALWPLLLRAQEAGVELVPGAGLAEVRVSPAPVSLQLDVRAADGAGSASTRLSVGAALDGRWYAADGIDLLGESGHGAALWTPASEAGVNGSAQASDDWVVTLAPLTRPVGPEVRRLLAAGHDLEVPVEDLPDLVNDYLPRLQRHVPVVSSDGSVAVPEPAVPRLALTVTWVAADRVEIAWTWRYAADSGERVYGLDETRGLRGTRRPELELELLDGLRLTDEQAYRLCRDPERPGRPTAEQTLTGGTAVSFAEDVLPGLEEAGQVEIEEIGARPDYREATGTPEVRFERRRKDGTAEQGSAGHGQQGDGEQDEESVDAFTDWLDLEVVIVVGGHFIALAHLLEAMTLGADRVVLRNGVHLRIDRPEFDQLRELVEAARELHEQPKDGVRVSRHDLALWDELAEIGLVDAQAEQWVRAARALRGVTALPEVAPPEGLQAELRHYQLEGFRWLAFLHDTGLGGILADDMGLGKTVQTLAMMVHARAQGAGPFLVVAPTSVVSTWAHEAATFTPGLVVRTVTESRSRRGTSIAELYRGADLVITSYTLYRLEADAYVGQEWGGLVLDEAQTVKNHQGKTYQAVRRLEAPFRLALTGTPMENRLMELWSLLSIVAPGLYPYPQRFVEQVAKPVERNGDKAALERFRRRIRPFLLRRTKDLVAADLPPKQESVLEVRLNPRHRKVYETHLQKERQHVLGLVGDFEKHRLAILRSLTRLRQMALDPALVSEQYEGIGSAKTDALVDHLCELAAEGHRALVFSQFTSFLTRVRARLEAVGLRVAYLDGRTRRRGEVVAEFREGEADVFLISLKAGGVGLTLTEADYVFVLDPWWNPAVEAQAVDRAHRIGQRHPVIVYRLVATGTIEEKVMELKARKAALFSRVVDGDGGAGAPVDADDVLALFED